MNEHPEFAIDLDKIIASKSKGRKFPAFLVRWMKRLLHVDFINEYLTQGYTGVEFCVNTIKYLDVKLDVRGFDRIDTSGQTKYTFVSNTLWGVSTAWRSAASSEKRSAVISGIWSMTC